MGEEARTKLRDSFHHFLLNNVSQVPLMKAMQPSPSPSLLFLSVRHFSDIWILGQEYLPGAMGVSVISCRAQGGLWLPGSWCWL